MHRIQMGVYADMVYPGNQNKIWIKDDEQNEKKVIHVNITTMYSLSIYKTKCKSINE